MNDFELTIPDLYLILKNPISDLGTFLPVISSENVYINAAVAGLGPLDIYQSTEDGDNLLFFNNVF